MSIPLTNSHEYAHDSFITIKKQLYSDETIMSIPLTNSHEYAHDSFITIKKQLYSDENRNNSYSRR
ncbi:MAG: hypothetical protein ACYCZO_12320 [Daejeonella sp.]